MADCPDVIMVGAGHNGLCSAILLAQAGLSVQVLEASDVIGGAVRTEYPFHSAPQLGISTGAYLLGLMPPELMTRLGIKLPLIKRDPYYFLPTTGDAYLLFGSDRRETDRQLRARFCAADVAADRAMQAELAALREDVAPTWLQTPHSIEETAERHVRPALRRAFMDLCRGSIGQYLARFGFESELLQAMYAVTDAFSGVFGSWDTPGTGMNFLIHNMCRLPGADGTWMIVKGGMGTVSQTLARRAQALGVQIRTQSAVAAVRVEEGVARGVTLEDGSQLSAPVVVCNADPFAMRRLVGPEHLAPDYNQRLDNYVRPGSTLKVNLCLSALPTFTCLPQDRGQFGTTIHLLPQQDVMGAMQRGFEQARAGQLPDEPMIEWYTHTALDPSLRDAEGRHNAALFVQWVPFEIKGSSWAAQGDAFVDRLLGICDGFAPDFSSKVQEAFVLPPPAIEQRFGMSHGHIHHVDNTFGFADRLPYRTPIGGLYSASAGCHPAGSVIGAAGHNAADCVLQDMGK